ncbi:hypothetical protein [Nannocystis pusilla]|uniref:hypothetical protein n=1 Tax=Nannocystis pusilla TaxID=889268 RepID=UPI003DA25156
MLDRRDDARPIVRGPARQRRTAIAGRAAARRPQTDRAARRARCTRCRVSWGAMRPPLARVAGSVRSTTLAVMTLPLRRASFRSGAARLAFAAACLAVTNPKVAAGAARDGGVIAAGAGDRCAAALTRLVEAGGALGYRIRADKTGFTGTRDARDLRAACSAGQVTIELVERGASVDVRFFNRAGPAFGLEIVGRFSALGSVRHTSMLGGTADRLDGSLVFAADTADAAAFVAFDLAGEVVAADGDADRVNERLAPVLAASRAWKDAHALSHALAGLGEARADAAMAIAVPIAGRRGVQERPSSHALARGAATITCTAAAGFVPAAGGGVDAAGGCALAVARSLVGRLD